MCIEHLGDQSIDHVQISSMFMTFSRFFFPGGRCRLWRWLCYGPDCWWRTLCALNKLNDGRKGPKLPNPTISKCQKTIKPSYSSFLKWNYFVVSFLSQLIFNFRDLGKETVFSLFHQPIFSSKPWSFDRGMGQFPRRSHGYWHQQYFQAFFVALLPNKRWIFGMVKDGNGWM